MDHSVSDNHQLTSEQPTKPTKSTAESVAYAGFWIRLWAYLLDLIVIGSLYRILVYPVFRWFDLPLNDASIFSLKVVMTTLIFFLYFGLLTRLFGQTLGKMVFAIRVVTKDLDKRPPWLTIIFREVVGRFISKVTWIGYLIASVTSEKRALHDIFADTRVIHTRK
ncbi:RDD family protein [Alkalihalobacillus sp. AL-G]|uniref:RDD family protein n=1 Tax=Alkalihalobacillus sp. AL-G TaxID=2926399 RepID=UPI00272B6C56|nr:RDD family protein [Alkalihalobacillus sp. AL-G]WLD92377.1 RDD family protein [Alkalihalobacillus sp. AL-G]